jgi:uncharacterized membrane protein
VSSEPLPEVARRSVQKIRSLETEAQSRLTRGDRLAGAVSRFAGSFPFLICQVAAILIWMGVNLALDASDRSFDPFPFDFLTLLLDIEVILFSTFVLMAQNREGREAEQRGHLQLQVSLLAEQETTKMLQMLRAICGRLGLDQTGDAELAQMVEATPVEALVRELEKTSGEGPSGSPPAAEAPGQDSPPRE